MAHEQIIRNGLIVENKFSFLNNPTSYVSGITQTGPLVDRNHIVTESAIKYTFDTLELTDLSGVNFTTPNNDDILVYNGSEWVATGMSSIAGDFYTKTESDLRFLNLDGNVAMTGDLDMGGNDITNVGDVDGVDISQLKSDYDTFTGTTYVNRTLGDISDVVISGITADDFIRWNGTAWVNVTTTTILGEYYTKTESENKFVDVSGDTMTGDLTFNSANINLNGGNIVMTGTETVDGVDISVFKTDFDTRSLTGNTDVNFSTAPTNEQLLQFNGTEWVNVDASSVVTNSYTKTESDDKFVFVSGDTMTGELKIEVGGQGNRALYTQGDAYILGDLYVSGVTTSINVENMAISDNLLLLNSGETGSGVSRGTAGFLVDRGPTTSAVTLMFDEASFTIRVGETESSLTDNTINTGHTVALATILDYNQMADNSFTFFKKHSATNGILMNLTGFTTDGNNIILNNSNIITNALVDGVDISTFKTSYDTFTGTTYVNRTFGQISDIDVTGAANDDIIAYNSTSGHWELTTVGSLAGDFYTKAQSDAKFVDVSGDTMTGTLILPSITLNGYNVTDIYDQDTMSSDSDSALATQQSIKAYVDNATTTLSIDDLTDVDTTTISPSVDEILRWDGSNWVNTGVSSVLTNYYTKSESDTNFVDAAGDTMTGNLNMGVNNITFTTGLVDGVDVSQLKSDYDTFTGTTYINRTLDDISDVTISSVSDKDVIYYDNGSSEWINGDLNTLMDNTYVNVDGDTMTGDLTITPLSGTSDRLVYVDSNGKLQESDKYIFKLNTTGMCSGDTILDTFADTYAKGCVWNYVVSDATDFQAGTIMAAFDSSNNTVEFSETTTLSTGGGWFSDISFDVDITSDNVRLLITISGGATWSIDLNRQMIG